MKRKIAIAAVLVSKLVLADIFNFSDMEGYKTCLANDHLEEVTTTSTGAQKRWLSKIDITVRCIGSAAKILTGKKDKAMMLEYVKVTKRATAYENSLPIVKVAVGTASELCNDMVVYEVFLRGLELPKSYIATDLANDLSASIKTCLKNAEFKKDFLEEKDNSNSYIKENACEILKAEKLVKSCPKV